MAFPQEFVWNEGMGLPPEGEVQITKDDPSKPASFTFRIVSSSELEAIEENIKEVYVDIEGLMKYVGLAPADITSLIHYVRTFLNEVKVKITGSGTDTVRLKLPEGWNVVGILIEGVPADYTFEDNVLTFTVELSSTKVVTIQMSSTTAQITSSVLSLLNLAALVLIMASFFKKVIRAIRSKRSPKVMLL